MRKYSEQSGFSLVEVLVVIAVLAILAGTLMGFSKRLRQQADEKLCKATIDILITAIEQYYDYHGEFPAYDPVLEDVAPARENYAIEILHDCLYSLPGSRKLCEQIQVSQIGDTDTDLSGKLVKDGRIEFLDPWGNALDYQTGIIDASNNYVPWTFPVIVSGGPDGDLTTTADNISSK